MVLLIACMRICMVDCKMVLLIARMDCMMVCRIACMIVRENMDGAWRLFLFSNGI